MWNVESEPAPAHEPGEAMNLTLSLLMPLVVGQPGPAAPAPTANPILQANCKTCQPARPSVMMPGQYPGLRTPIQMPCPPSGPPAPVLAGRVIAPDGVKVTILPGSPSARTFPAPSTFAFRPGYIYRLAISNLPGHPGVTLYPVLEVRGSLVPRNSFKYMDFPAPVLITRGDIDRVVAGSMITKIIYLEDPTKASPVASRPDEPIELVDETEGQALRAARESGRPVAMLHLGDRKPTEEDLARFAIDGTVLAPGDARLPAPSVPPPLPCIAVPLYDPILGPKPTPEECITDGGDKGARLGIGPGQRLGGLDPTDVAVEYTQNAKRKVTTSNEVCLCVPRFVIRRVELGIGKLHAEIVAGVTKQTEVWKSNNNVLPPQAVATREKPVAAVGTVRPQQQIGIVGAHIISGEIKPVAIAQVQGVRVVAALVEPEEVTNANQFVVTKSIDPSGDVQVGEIVTVTIRYQNNTRAAVTDVVVSDSLSGRLEYVPGSAQSDRPTNVTTSENEVGSVVVRFEIPGTVNAGQGGVVKFQVKVR